MDISNPPPADAKPWKPMSDPVDIKTLVKFGEELGECVSADMRCMAQGIDEVDPETGYPNRKWLEDEIADVQAGAELTIERFKLDQKRIDERKAFKKKFLKAWHDGAAD